MGKHIHVKTIIPKARWKSY